MNKLALLTATPGTLILADWAAHEHDAGYNTALARGLSMAFIIAALGLFIKGQSDLLNKQKQTEARRAEAIRAMLQKTLDRNIKGE